MCGIIGYTGSSNAADIILAGLQRLEYRGYDSAGVAVVLDGRIERRRAEGKLIKLADALRDRSIEGSTGIGHTRWATHGRPTEFNAHPHIDCTGNISVVHNGIIENYLKLKEGLIAQGHEFRSQTDTEVLAHLIESELGGNGGDVVDALRGALKRVEGAYAIGVICAGEPDTLYAARKSSPLILGLGDGENFIASDVPAILPYTRSIIYLDDEEVAVIKKDSVVIEDLDGNEIEKEVEQIEWNPVLAEKGGYPHFMLKEIHEQPQVIRNTIGGRTDEESAKIYLDEVGLDVEKVRRLRNMYIIGCGTAYYAGVVGKYMIEKLAGIHVDVDMASEFRYRNPMVDENTLVIVISQSGETADTLAALRMAKERGATVIGIVNVKGSSIAREVDGVLYIHAGPEIGVASTKAYVAMLIAELLLSIQFGRMRELVTVPQARELIHLLKELPQKIELVLEQAPQMERIAERFCECGNFLYLGRGINFPTAMEGALKLKEISYIHAEAYAAGEMKHGPIALIDKRMPVVAIATQSGTGDKMISNMQEVIAREGMVIAIATEGDERIKEYTDYIIRVPDPGDESLSPIINVVPLQLLAYKIAIERGSDVDQPRNLAKSVTVE
ncbi:MAG TPA: glutamine--fructose-6-phosphate transaminase (isomerizing) [bacterium]|nr:glutamine--fructose-6-phosphate transaminase (isomerizing) [bacterium]